ncbi:DUF1116 domain-containing protein [Arthrobacter sulfonylureivorans]|uniref:DUF1116 domain-containing protein n=1 Tax=Arthrobacter sulfonylureivorans TaxID=2486855 RepID=A0ABY3WEI5_9MICC|nr:DUF1116 domain-containing protein [Arthrobacter sulfonylureivorans]UNK46099.1 DUF1116 domain-containing protein [Arthrobacter sulfonylureivorans]
MSANAQAAARIGATEPVWTGMAPLAQVLAATGCPERTLLHAGPTFSSRNTVPQPVRNSVVQAILFEGWASTMEAAEELFDSGAVGLEPAQDHNCLVPLAGVISPSMQLHVVTDAESGRVQYAVLNEGMRHCLRVGVVEPGLVDHQHWLHGPFALWLSDRLAARGPLPLLPLLAASLEQGDDGHNRTMAGSALVASELLHNDASAFRSEAEAFLAECLPFALNLWMAAAALSLRTAEGTEGSDAVTRVGGNGIDFGVQIAAEPGRWRTVAGTPPRGPIPAEFEGLPVLGAIGDSAVLDFFGLGGASLRHAPLTLGSLGEFAPAEVLERPEALMELEHPRLPIRTGVSASRIAEAGRTPVVLLGMIEGQGLEGRIGGGAFEPSLTVFQEALAAPVS